jgi:hypothetical protein
MDAKLPDGFNQGVEGDGGLVTALRHCLPPALAGWVIPNWTLVNPPAHYATPS